MKSLFKKTEIRRGLFLILLMTLIINALQGQDKKTFLIKGKLKDQVNMQGMAFTTVALRRAADSTLITGTMSNDAGEFSLRAIPSGKYRVEISAIGYDLVILKVDLMKDFDAGDIIMKEKSISLGEVVVQGERMKTKTEADRTTYFINSKMYDASSNGVELLTYIPGVQVDLMKNISLQGSRHVIILVDGKERDRSFLGQLSSDKIDKIEVVNSPDPKYDADVTGVINIILKKNKESGLSGNIHAEIPTSSSEIYSYPAYSFNYSIGKFNLFTSYNGEFSYFRNTETSYRDFQSPAGNTSVTSEQVMRQQDWSHRFHYGLDYELNEKNQISFYAFNNPYSNELDGNVEMKVNPTDSDGQQWSAIKDDSDINHASLYSINYKHGFDKPGREIVFDLGYFSFNAKNSTTYTITSGLPTEPFSVLVNIVSPEQHSLNFKTDFSTPLNEKLKLDAGIKIRTQVMKDRQSSGFSNTENIFALYGATSLNRSIFTLIAGVRAEESIKRLADGSDINVLSILPNLALNFKLPAKQNIKVAYNRSVYRPNIYQLNPYISANDPVSLESGNPGLKPEYFQNISVEYSLNPNNNYMSVQLYHNTRVNAISHYTFVNDTGIVETHIGNLGKINAYGIQFTGALKLGKSIALNPYLRVSYLYSSVNSIPQQYNINNIYRMVYESSLSAIVSFKHDIVASFQFQYNSPQIDIQGISFSDMLYFISLEKTIAQRFKIGITSAIPFLRKFTYQGTEINDEKYYCHSEGNIRLSAFPVWLKLNYQFNSGKKTRASESQDGDNVTRKKGF